MAKKLLSVLLTVMMLFSLAACGASETTEETATEEGAEVEEVESDNPWADVDVTDEEAWKQEPAYGETLHYFVGDMCTTAPYIADVKGFYEAEGLDVEGFKGTTHVEALGTNSAQIAVGHIATLLVPATNGVELTFVGGSIIGCKSLYVLADSEFETTEDLRGQKISAPNGIGASDYNILARFFNNDGMDPTKDVELVQVEVDACIAAMQRGEIAGALFADQFAEKLVQDGTLRMVRSLFDEDFSQEPCCVVAMNTSFIEENPITAKKMAIAVKKAEEWMRENPEEGVKLELEDGVITGDEEMLIKYWNLYQFGLTDEFTESALHTVVDDYIKLGLVTAMDDHDAIMDIIWTPIAPEY